jgi:hypothetical protein
MDFCSSLRGIVALFLGMISARLRRLLKLQIYTKEILTGALLIRTEIYMKPDMWRKRYHIIYDPIAK